MVKSCCIYEFFECIVDNESLCSIKANDN